MKIRIWADFACPFCYMGETQLKKIITENGLEDSVELEYKAYELDPEAPVVPVESMKDHFASSHDITPDEAEKEMEHIAKMASRQNLTYNMEGVKVCSTFDAHRLVKYAKDNLDDGKVVELCFKLFKANFTENLALSDRETLARIGSEAGLDSEKVLDMLAGDSYKEAVRADEAEAERRDLEYIPYLLLEDGSV